MDLVHISASFIYHVHHSSIFNLSILHSCFLYHIFLQVFGGNIGLGYSAPSFIYSELSPCDFHLIMLLKEYIVGKKIVLNVRVKNAVDTS